MSIYYPPGADRVERRPTTLQCDSCAHQFEATAIRDLGFTYYRPEECPVCGSVEIEEAEWEPA